MSTRHQSSGLVDLGKKPPRRSDQSPPLKGPANLGPLMDLGKKDSHRKTAASFASERRPEKVRSDSEVFAKKSPGKSLPQETPRGGVAVMLTIVSVVVFVLLLLGYNRTARQPELVPVPTASAKPAVVSLPRWGASGVLRWGEDLVPSRGYRDQPGLPPAKNPARDDVAKDAGTDLMVLPPDVLSGPPAPR